ncbi:unnamed protein product [Dovyalis caffra]|uniref:F-box domain-containing protein n=1 Tax=Dovyalis caffra TaxID=77055 RepID=A0AAV1R8K6_9ROSI|nr:unnamed protein product [Dovyalis caffra]
MRLVMQELPQSIGDLSELVVLNLKELANALGIFRRNIFVEISSYCRHLKLLIYRQVFGLFKEYEVLVLARNRNEELPSSIGGLRKLISLDLSVGPLFHLPV